MEDLLRSLSRRQDRENMQSLLESFFYAILT